MNEGTAQERAQFLNHGHIVEGVLDNPQENGAFGHLVRACIDGAIEPVVAVLDDVSKISPERAFDTTRALMVTVKAAFHKETDGLDVSESRLAPLVEVGLNILAGDEQQNGRLFTDGDKGSFIELAYDFEPSNEPAEEADIIQSKENDEPPTDPVDLLNYRVAQLVAEVGQPVLNHILDRALGGKGTREDFFNMLIAYPGKKGTPEQELIDLFSDFSVIKFAENEKSVEASFETLDKFGKLARTKEGKDAVDRYHDTLIIYSAITTNSPRQRKEILKRAPRTEWGRQKIEELRPRQRRS